MASVNGLNRLGLPKLSENMDPEDARALRSYLYQMQEQLQYVLTIWTWKTCRRSCAPG